MTKLLAKIVQLGHAQLSKNHMENQQPQTLTFEFTIEEANAILAGLQELPGKICNPLSAKIQHQARAQLEPPKPEGELADKVIS